MSDKNIAKYSGHQHFRHRLVLSFLSGKPVLIDNIRSEDKNPGLRGKDRRSCKFYHSKSLYLDYEVNVLRLLEKITNGTVIEIGYTGM